MAYKFRSYRMLTENEEKIYDLMCSIVQKYETMAASPARSARHWVNIARYQLDGSNIILILGNGIQKLPAKSFIFNKPQ